MGAVLVSLLLGFTFNSASAFTAAFSRRWGAKHGQWVTFVLRNLLGIPLWVIGLGLAVRSPSPALFAGRTLLATLGWVMLAAGAASSSGLLRRYAGERPSPQWLMPWSSTVCTVTSVIPSMPASYSSLRR